MGMGGKGGGQGFYQNPQQQQGGFYNQPGLMGFPDQGYQQPMQPMQPMGAGQPPTTYGGSMIRDPNYGGGYGGPPGFNPDGSPVMSAGGNRPVTSTAGIDRMQDWARSNPNSPFLPNDRPNPFYSGPPGGQFGGRGGSSPMPTPLPLEPTPQIQPAVQAPQPNFVPFVGADGGPVQVARPPVPPRVPVRRAPVQPTPQMAPTSQIMSSQAEQQAAMDRYMARRRGR